LHQRGSSQPVLPEEQEPAEWMRRFGRELALIRPSRRRALVVPEVREEEVVMPAERDGEQDRDRQQEGEEGAKGRKEGAQQESRNAEKKREMQLVGKKGLPQFSG
jgi:hypothetical protein